VNVTPPSLLLPALAIIGLVPGLVACSSASTPFPPPPSRLEAIPRTAVKGTPENNGFPPVLHSADWLPPVPMPGPANTAGAEDSPFIAPDGSTFFFFFTPNVNIPPQKSVLDGFTSIWWTQRVGGG